MANTATNVTFGKPATTGSIYRAPLGTTLPTDATTAIATVSNAYISMGYIAEGGVINSNSPESTELKAWGGDVVANVINGRPDKFKFGLIETLNPDVIKVPYGDDNVSGTLAAGITVLANAQDLPESVYVIDQVLRNGALKRIVIPDGKVTEVGDIVYADNDAVQYPVTITAMASSAISGSTHKEFIKAATPATT